jgi:lipoprotein-anchoring transpeptidase ErfK/SrfK
MKLTTGKLSANWLLAAFVLAFADLAAAQISTAAASSERTHRLVLVSITDRRLAVLEDNKVLAYFPVAVGAEVSPSPVGDFEIVRRVANPTYSHDGVVIPAGQDNPVGTRWMALNVKGYGIHGTNQPRSIGHARSHGCIRLRNRDVEKLYAMLQVGDLVRIRAGRDEEVAAVFGGAPDVAVAQASSSTGGQ